MRPPNRVLLKCSACGSKVYFFPKGRWYWLRLGIFIAFNEITIWRNDPSLIVGMLLALVLALPFGYAFDRLYHSFWLWWHPAHCQGDGHIAPQTT